MRLLFLENSRPVIAREYLQQARLRTANEKSEKALGHFSNNANMSQSGDEPKVTEGQQPLEIEAGPVHTEQPKQESLAHIAATFVLNGAKSAVLDTIDLAKDVKAECFNTEGGADAVRFIKANFMSFVHIPYFPAFHRPGWMLRYIVGPHTVELMSNLFSDFWAGVTVALTLIPQVCR